MMHDRDDTDAIRHDLQRWRDMLKGDIDDHARRAIRDLIDGAEKRINKIEAMHEEL